VWRGPAWETSPPARPEAIGDAVPTFMDHWDATDYNGWSAQRLTPDRRRQVPSNSSKLCPVGSCVSLSS
jgi:hypothetical protein